MIRVFECELDVNINEVSESFTFSLKSKYTKYIDDRIELARKLAIIF